MIRLGILGCSEIAFRRFMPAAQKITGLNVIAVAEEYDKTKLQPFCQEYKIEGMESFDELINRSDVDAVYVPQPPAFHYVWARKALGAGKHVLIEKPSTTSLADSSDLVSLAKEKGLALHENYMFQYHSQISKIKEMLESGVIGDIRLYSAQFGFPMRSKNDFRYSKMLGGGALLDAGGYTLKLATIYLGNSIKVDSAKLNYLDGFEVDMYGNARLINDNGVVFNVAFGMDCGYRCSFEAWGSIGRLYTNRIFTAPDGYEPIVYIENNDGTKEVRLDTDSHFTTSISEFISEISSEDKRHRMYDSILTQARLVESVESVGKQ